MHVSHLSSVVLGVFLGYLMEDNSVCPHGYIALHVVVLWLRAVAACVYPFMCSTCVSSYSDHNCVVAELDRVTSVPRVSHVGQPRIAQYVLLSVLCGACDALSLTMKSADGDCHILSVAALAVSTRSTRVPLCVLMVYVFLSRPLPLVHGILRGLVCTVSVLSGLAMLPPPWAVLRLLAAGVVVVASNRSACESKLGAVSPAFLIYFSLYSFRVNPVLLLTFAVFVLL